MVSASIEIARIAYRKFEKGWFQPKFVENGEIETGSRKPMEGRTRTRVSILERTIWRNQRIETQISVPATS